MASLSAAIARNTAIHTAGRVVSVLLALFVVGIMTRALGPDGFGGYSTVIAFLQFFGITVDFGLTLTANRMISASSREESTHILSNLMTLRFVSAVVFLGIAPFVALLFPYSAEVKQSMFLTTLSFLAIIMGQTLVPVFQKALHMSYVAWSEIAGRLVLLAAIGLAAYFKLNLLWFMGAIVLGSIAQFIVIQLAVRQFVRWRFAYDREMWRKIIMTSWPIGVSIIFNLIYLKADTIILSVLRPQAEVGFYGASYRVIDQFTALATMFIGLILPPLTVAWVSGARERFARIYQGTFDAYAVIAFPLAVGALLIGRPLMSFVAGADFAISGTLLGILMIAMIGIFFSTLFGHMIVVLEKQKKMIWGYAAVAVLALILYPLIILRWGMLGAAWATVGTETLITGLTFLMVWRVTHLVPKFAVLWKSIFASVIMGIFLYVLHTYNLALLLAGGALIYFATLYLLGGIKKQMLREILLIKSP